MTEALAIRIDDRPETALAEAGRQLAGRSIAIVGLGYVGLPSALALHDAGASVVGIDVSERRIAAIRAQDVDLPEADVERLRGALDGERLELATIPSAIGAAEVVIICVPTPVDSERRPDPRALRLACCSVVEHAREGQLVVLSSTTYVGCTRELLVEPLALRGLQAGRDVCVAFAPERINPGDTSFSQRDVPRVVGGATPHCSARARELLSTVTAHVHEVSSLEAAELTKLYENTFRAVNIAFANEMADVTVKLGLDPVEVIGAAATKPYGFLGHYPGPGIGGHCIPVDPHYLLAPLRTSGVCAPITERAMTAIAERPVRVAERAIAILRRLGSDATSAVVLIVGMAYKAGIADVRESPGVLIAEHLERSGVGVSYYDRLLPSVRLGSGTVLRSETRPDPSRFELAILTGAYDGADHDWLARCADVLDATYRTHAGLRRHLI